MPESAASRRMRWGFNLFPAYRGTGARVTVALTDGASVVHAEVEKTVYIRRRKEPDS